MLDQLKTSNYKGHIWSFRHATLLRHLWGGVLRGRQSSPPQNLSPKNQPMSKYFRDFKTGLLRENIFQ